MDVKAKLDELQALYNRLCAEYGHAEVVAHEAATRADTLRTQINSLRAKHAELSSLAGSPAKAPPAAAVASDPSPDTVGG
jgi:hypothetical protein